MVAARLGTALTRPRSAVPRRTTILCVAALVAGALLWLHATGPGAGAGFDFDAYVQGARDIASGRNPYHSLVQQTSDTRLGDIGIHSRGYVYPPLLAFTLSLPLRVGVSARVLWLLWNILNAGVVFWMGRELNRALRGRRDLAGALCFSVAALAPTIATYDLWLGQADILVAALAVIACGLWLRRNPWAGVTLGGAIAIKPTVALVMIVWLWKGDWRATLRAALAGAALIFGPFLILGAASLADYVTFFTGWNAFHANAEIINQSPYGMLQRALEPNAYTRPLVSAAWLVTPLRVVVTFGLLVWWMRVVPLGRALGAVADMGACLLSLPMILLLGPLSEDIHFCLLIPTLIGFAWLAWRAGLIRQPAGVAICVALLLACIPRGQEFIYPDHLLTLPLQTDTHVGWIVVLARSGALLALALLTVFASGGVLRAMTNGVTEKQPAPVALQRRSRERDGS